MTLTRPQPTDPRDNPSLAAVLDEYADAIEALQGGGGGGITRHVLTLGPGTPTDSVALAAGSDIVEAWLDFPEAFDAGTLDVGDGDDPDGYMAAFDLAGFGGGYAVVGQSTQTLSSVPGVSSGAVWAGAYLNTSTYGMKRHYPAGGTLTATITGSPTTGEVRVVVLVAS